MKSLFLDTSTSVAVVSILDETKILSKKKYSNTRLLSENIFQLIDECFSEAELKPKDIDTIYVVNGPGSFTGIRIGVTIAKTMAWTLNKKIITISSLECIASSGNNKNNIAYIDARREYVFGAIYDEKLNIVLKDSYISLEQLKSYSNEDSMWFSNDKLLDSTIPDYDLSKIIKKHENDIGIDPHKVVPNYLKLTEAEEKRKSTICD